MSEKYLYWLAVEDGKPIRFADLPHMMALAMHPASDVGYGAARVTLEQELPKAVQRGELVVRNPLDMGNHTFPFGDALNRAVMLIHDLRPFLESRGIELRVNPHGSGPDFWTIENAALAMAVQEGWHNGTRATFLDQMVSAANARELVVRDPQTDLQKRSGEVRQYWELVSPDDVNTWLANQKAKFRWEPRSAAYQAEYDKGWKTSEEIDRVKADLARWERASAVTVTELHTKEKKLLELTLKLAELNASLSAQPEQPTQAPVTDDEIVYELPLFARLEPRTPWTGGRMAAVDILPIAEAAKLASRHAGHEITVGDFLRAGFRGEISIQVVCPRTVTMQPARAGDIVLTMQQGSYPRLPYDACEMLSITGKAGWRIREDFEPAEAFGGAWCRFARWRLPVGEPDLVSTVADCLVSGSDVHALADAYTHTEVHMDDRPYAEPVAKVMTSPVAAVVQSPENSKPKAGTDGPVFSTPRAALIAAHKHRWPTIARDLQDASTNGLSAAKAGPREWYESVALEWAKAKGKLKDEGEPAASDISQAMRNMASLPSKKHRMEG